MSETKSTKPNKSNKLNFTKEQLNAIALYALDYYTQGKVAEAETMFKGLVIADNSFYGYAGLGAIALNQDPPKLDDAQGYLAIAADLRPEDPSVHTNLGEVFLHQRKFREAADEFQKAIDLDPEKRDPAANRARAMTAGLKAVAAEYQKMGVSAA
jgi:tetratricopeptide (TPR) repeat protein